MAVNLISNEARIRVVEPFDLGVPLPSTIQEPIGGVLQHDLVTLRDVDGLICHLLSQRRNVLGLDRRFDQLRELLDGLLQVPGVRLG